MESESRDHDSARARGDLGNGRGTVDRMRSRLQLHLDWVHGGSSTERGHRQPSLASGGTATGDEGSDSGSYGQRVDIDEARRRGSGNRDDENDVPMRNGSAKREAPWRGTLIVLLWPFMKSALLGNIVEAEWWFQFGGEVPNPQKYALKIVSQCVSSSGCERNWSAWALVHTKQRNRLLYGKLHKFVSVRHNLKIRAEEDKDRVRENDKYKEVDPCAMMMDTTMFDEANPMMEWLNEDEEHVILDGSDAASAVFEEIRRLSSSKKASHLGRKDNGTKRRRVLEEDEDDCIDCDDDDEEEDEYLDIDDEDDGGDDSASEADGEDSPTRVEKDQPSQIGNDVEERNDGGLLNHRRSRWGKQSKKLKD